MTARWCVTWTDRTTGRRVWCATKRGRRPDPMAVSDETACNHFVSFRVGEQIGEPTCVDCLALMRR